MRRSSTRCSSNRAMAIRRAAWLISFNYRLAHFSQVERRWVAPSQNEVPGAQEDRSARGPARARHVAGRSPEAVWVVGAGKQDRRKGPTQRPVGRTQPTGKPCAPSGKTQRATRLISADRCFRLGSIQEGYLVRICQPWSEGMRGRVSGVAPGDAHGRRLSALSGSPPLRVIRARRVCSSSFLVRKNAPPSPMRAWKPSANGPPNRGNGLSLS